MKNLTRLVPILGILALTFVANRSLVAQDAGDAVPVDCVNYETSGGLTDFAHYHDELSYRLVGNDLYAGTWEDSCYSIVASFDFPITTHDFAGGTLYLSDGARTYRHDLGSGTTAIASDAGRLANFLSAPVTEVIGNQTYYGCMESHTETTRHAVRPDLGDEPSLLHQTEPVVGLDRDGTTPFDAKKIAFLLRRFDQDPDRMPSLVDFGVTAHEVGTYLDEVGNEDHYMPFYYETEEEPDRAELRRVVDRIDAIDADLVRDAIAWGRDHFYRYTHGGEETEVILVNARNDTLRFLGSAGSGASTPFQLPWIVEYRGERSLCYDPGLARFLSTSLLEQTDQTAIERHTPGTALLWCIAGYLTARDYADRMRDVSVGVVERAEG